MEHPSTKLPLLPLGSSRAPTGFPATDQPPTAEDTTHVALNGARVQVTDVEGLRGDSRRQQRQQERERPLHRSKNRGREGLGLCVVEAWAAGLMSVRVSQAGDEQRPDSARFEFTASKTP